MKGKINNYTVAKIQHIESLSRFKIIEFLFLKLQASTFLRANCLRTYIFPEKSVLQLLEESQVGVEKLKKNNQYIDISCS